MPQRYDPVDAQGRQAVFVDKPRASRKSKQIGGFTVAVNHGTSQPVRAAAHPAAPPPQRPAAPRVPGDRDRAAGEGPIDWALATGRITAGRVAHYRAQMAANAAVTTDILETLAPGALVGGGVHAGPQTYRAPVAAATPAGASAEAYSRNPLLDEARASRPYLVTLASAEGPAATLFESGDLPAFTASGQDPQALLRLPWKVRHAAARADQAEWARLFDEYQNDPISAGMDYTHDPANQEYAGRVSSWLGGPRPIPYSLLPAEGVQQVRTDGTPVGQDANAAVYDAMFPEQPAATYPTGVFFGNRG